MPIINTTCIVILGNNPILFGKSRVYGAISWGINVFILGYLLDRYGFLSGFLNMTFFAACFIGIVVYYLDIEFYRD